MQTRLTIFRLAAFAAALALALLPSLAFAAPADAPAADVCRRLHTAGLERPRCDPDRPPVDPAAYCRRVWGTDEWTRRCAHRPDFDPYAFCRRIWGTDEWTRRCLHLDDDKTRPAVQPAAEPAQPADAALTARPMSAEVVARPQR